jgi:hypothetical protein
MPYCCCKYIGEEMVSKVKTCKVWVLVFDMLWDKIFYPMVNSKPYMECCSNFHYMEAYGRYCILKNWWNLEMEVFEFYCLQVHHECFLSFFSKSAQSKLQKCIYYIVQGFISIHNIWQSIDLSCSKHGTLKKKTFIRHKYYNIVCTNLAWYIQIQQPIVWGKFSYQILKYSSSTSFNTRMNF